MRRNSLIILMSMVVLLIVIAGLLFYTFLRSAASDAVGTGTMIQTTLPVPPEQQITPSSEPVGTPLRLVYIISILAVFVSAVLLLFRLLMRFPGKDKE